MPADMIPYRNAIASIESAGSGDYGAVGPRTRSGNQAYGRYQVMDFNIGPWTQQALGYSMTPQQFLADPAAQDAVFDHIFGGYVDRYGNEGAARAWFTGSPTGTGSDGYTSADTYVRRFNTALGSPSQLTPRPSSSAAQPKSISTGNATGPAPPTEAETRWDSLRNRLKDNPILLAIFDRIRNRETPLLDRLRGRGQQIGVDETKTPLNVSRNKQNDAFAAPQPMLYQGIGINSAPSSEVRALQEYLNGRGAGLVVDGRFGPNTKAAVEAFQRAAGIRVDGVVGPETRDAMARMSAVKQPNGNVVATGAKPPPISGKPPGGSVIASGAKTPGSSQPPPLPVSPGAVLLPGDVERMRDHFPELQPNPDNIRPYIGPGAVLRPGDAERAGDYMLRLNAQPAPKAQLPSYTGRDGAQYGYVATGPSAGSIAPTAALPYAPNFDTAHAPLRVQPQPTVIGGYRGKMDSTFNSAGIPQYGQPNASLPPLVTGGYGALPPWSSASPKINAVTAMGGQQPLDPINQAKPWQVGGTLPSSMGPFGGAPPYMMDLPSLPVTPSYLSSNVAMNEKTPMVAPAAGFYPNVKAPALPPPLPPPDGSNISYFKAMGMK